MVHGGEECAGRGAGIALGSTAGRQVGIRQPVPTPSHTAAVQLGQAGALTWPLMSSKSLQGSRQAGKRQSQR